MSLRRVVTAAGDIDHETILAESLAFRPDFELVLRCLDRVELLAVIRGGGLDAIILVGEVDWFDHQLASEASARGITVVSLSDGVQTPDTARSLQPEAGLNEILAACESPPIAAGRSASTATGVLAAVWGPKGSPGRTRIAVDLAFALQMNGMPSALLDADPYGGDITQLLGIVEELPTVIWASLMASKGELDVAQLEANLRRAGKGPVVIPGLPRAALWPDVTEFGFRELLEICRENFRHTVIDAGFCLEAAASLSPDGSEGRNRMAREALRRADRVVAVCRCNPVGIRNFLWSFEELCTVVDSDKVIIVANRVSESQERDVARLLHKHLGRRPVAYLPDEPDIMRSAAETASPAWVMKGGSELRAAIEALAISVGAKLRPRGVLTRLGARG